MTKNYQVVELCGKACFRKFVDKVTETRRSGDTDQASSVIAETIKLIGNSAYGSLIMDKSKHHDIQYVKGTDKACLKINEPTFRQVSTIFFEVEMSKKTHMFRSSHPFRIFCIIISKTTNARVLL